MVNILTEALEDLGVYLVTVPLTVATGVPMMVSIDVTVAVPLGIDEVGDVDGLMVTVLTILTMVVTGVEEAETVIVLERVRVLLTTGSTVMVTVEAGGGTGRVEEGFGSGTQTNLALLPWVCFLLVGFVKMALPHVAAPFRRSSPRMPSPRHLGWS